MSGKVMERALTIIRKMQQNELTESVIYEKIARFAKGEENKRTLQRLAQEEKAHYEIWKKYAVQWKEFLVKQKTAPKH